MLNHAMKTSSIKSKKGVIFLSVIVAALAASSVFWLLLEELNSGDNKQENTERVELPTVDGVRYPAGSSLHCPATVASTSIIDAGGFATVKAVYKGDPPTYDFVLRPGSKGYITAFYQFFEGNEQLMSSYDKDFFENSSNQLWRLSELPNSIPPEKIGVRIDAIITDVDALTMKVTYNISTEASTERGTYLMWIFQTCPGQLLTIGDEPHEGSLPWDDGTMY